MFQPFGLDKALKALQDGQALTGKDGILAYTNFSFVNVNRGVTWGSVYHSHEEKTF